MKSNSKNRPVTKMDRTSLILAMVARLTDDGNGLTMKEIAEVAQTILGRDVLLKKTDTGEHVEWFEVRDHLEITI